MADKKISQLTNYTPPVPTDVLPIVDTTGSTTKKITVANLLTYLNGALASLVKATTADTTPGSLDTKIEITSDDESILVTKTIENPGAAEKIVYDLSVVDSGSGSSGSGLSGGKPMTFALSSDSEADNSLKTGYIDREALVLINGVLINLLDPQGNSQRRDLATDWADVGQVLGYALIGLYFYVFMSDGDNPVEYRLYRFDAADLSTGGTLMTVSGFTLPTTGNLTGRMTSNGTHIFMNFFDGGSNTDAPTINKFSISGTTITFVSDVTCGATPAQFTTSWGVTSEENYYGHTGGVLYQYDNTGSITYTSGIVVGNNDGGSWLNWTNTFYSDGGDAIFTKMYLPDTEDQESGEGVRIRATAAEDLVAGDKVGISNMLENYIARAKTLARTLTITPDARANMYQNSAVIADNKFVYVYEDNVSGTLKAVVVTVDTTDFSAPFTFGTPVTITTSQTTGAYEANVFDVCKLDTNKFAVIYSESGSNTITKVVVATVSGTTISLGTPANLDSSATAVWSMAICQMATDKAAVIIGKSSNHAVLCFTVSGTTPTVGSPVTTDLLLRDQDLQIGKVATDKFVVNNNQTLNTQCGTISGTTITLGAAQSYSGGAGAGLTASNNIISPADNVVVIGYDSGGQKLIAATISGTTLTFGTAVTSTAGYGGIIPLSATTFLLKGNSDQAVLYTLSGTAISASIQIEEIASALGRRNLMDFGTYWMTFGTADTSAQFFIKGMSNNFIGIVQANVSQGQSASIIISGIDRNQTGLVTGTQYLVGSGGILTRVATDITVNTLNDIDVVKAISSTAVLI